MTLLIRFENHASSNDVIMSKMSGFSLYSEIRKSDNKISICFLTAASDVYYETLKKSYPDIDEKCIIHKPLDNDSTKTNKINTVKGSWLIQLRIRQSKNFYVQQMR